jgi:hypothetical protein
MPVRLVYTGSETKSGTVSPFDKEIQRISGGNDLSIACPYISVRYLTHLVGKAKGWRLVTDCGEWLGALSPKARSAAYAFITKNRRRIHHYPRLHAKVILTDRSALIGSANLTEEGLTRRVEMAALMEDEPDLGEARKWFDGLWKQSGEVEGNELKGLIRSLPKKDSRLTRWRAGDLSAYTRSRLLPNRIGGDSPGGCACLGTESRLRHFWTWRRNYSTTSIWKGMIRDSLPPCRRRATPCNAGDQG